MNPQEASDIICDNIQPTSIERIPFTAASGRILREEILADRPLPPFDRAMMDGIAVDSTTIKKNAAWEIKAEALAGQPQIELAGREMAIRINTGAVLPVGCDQIIPIEELSVEGDIAKLTGQAEQEPEAFIHRSASDFSQGSILLEAGCQIGGKEMGVITSCGKSFVEVAASPSIALISTGNELVEVDTTPKPHQIRRSNTHALEAICSRLGIHAVSYHLPDDVDAIDAALPSILEQYDWIIISGGISKGTADYIPDYLHSLGAERHFQWVKQRPGKPLAFFTLPNKKPIFALPGNPMSTLVCFHRYIVRALYGALGHKERPACYVRLAENFTFKKPLALFLPVSIQCDSNGVQLAYPRPTANSGDFASIMDTDGFIELPADKNVFAEGEGFLFTPWL